LPKKYHEFTQELDKFEVNIGTLKTQFVSILDDKKTIVDFYLQSSLQTHYPTLSFLAGIKLDLPPSSAEVERIFWRLNLTKTIRRNNLSEDNLASLILLNTSKLNISEDTIYERVFCNQKTA